MNLKTILKNLNQGKLFFIFLIVTLIVVYPLFGYSQDNQQVTQFNFLEKTLISYGFTVKKEIPPYKNRYGIRPYGLLEGKTQTVWINPVVFDLGNAKATIIHEAVHAAQLCVGNKEEFKLLNLDIEPPKMTHPYFMRYHNYRKEIEAEAYTVQVQPNSLEIAKNFLDSYCSSNNNK
ncbi:conserved hypothetical protein [Hyella patelloides LEGE 07179]|uniref:Uncharacterized protein n=1 Tax=Hyella patelloides LEGE 07179 TaxID=945734 RepID=A0A563W526_9CYAN|nr:hypothetical protein [Hyella patelloides]VEP18802.1 conserved hypothetical protein [Hyella patelloides LEGE 07179]